MNCVTVRSTSASQRRSSCCVILRPSRERGRFRNGTEIRNSYSESRFRYTSASSRPPQMDADADVATTRSPTRNRRSDAIANRERVLVAARECFAESADAQVQDVARRAGVGVGTVYRHFANKEALMVALALNCVDEIHRYASDALAQ